MGCRPTDLESDVKEPLRTTSSMAVTTLSVPISKHYTYIHTGRRGAAAKAHHFGSRNLGCNSPLPRGVALLLEKKLHSLDPGVNGCLVRHWLLVCMDSFQRRDGSRGCMLPRVVWYWNGQVPYPGNICKSSYYSAFGCQVALVSPNSSNTHRNNNDNNKGS